MSLEAFIGVEVIRGRSRASRTIEKFLLLAERAALILGCPYQVFTNLGGESLLL